MMNMANKKNDYDVTRDLVLGPVLLIHISAATGERVSNFGEGVESFGIALRRMMKEDGSAGPVRVSIHGAFVAKKAGTVKFQRWQVGAGGKAALGVTAEGSVCLGAGIGRLDAPVAMTLYPVAGSFAAKAMAALAAKPKAA
jgi:hypothetical protein